MLQLGYYSDRKCTGSGGIGSYGVLRRCDRGLIVVANAAGPAAGRGGRLHDIWRILRIIPGGYDLATN